MLAGDLVDTGLYRDQWDQLFTHLNHFSSKRPLVPAIGNHDDQEGLGASMYLKMFALPANGPSEIEPERAYSFRYGNALVAMLDIASPMEPQVAWLDRVLSKTDARWKFVMLHFPPFTMSNEYEDLGRVLTRLCDKHHVDVVMNGHIHVYLRTCPMKGGKRMDKPSEGTTYITSIAVPSRKFKRKTPDWVAAFVSGPALYQTFEIDGDRCVYRACDLDGRVRDKLVIEK
jgi:calcineurin-like phosphoesterase family protein